MCDFINNFGIRIVRAFALPCKNKRAVLSVEAAAALPLFLISVMTLITLINTYYINSKIEAAINEEARYISYKHYDDGYSVGALEADIESRLGDRFLNSCLIKGGDSGLNYENSDLSDREFVKISVGYTVKAPFSMFSMFEIPFEKTVIMHTNIGYINGLNGFYDYSDYVYMTKNGTVYHRSRECSHIRLTIKCVKSKDIKTLRNSDGKKYKKCEYCHPRLKDGKLYITDDGDKYHNTLMCIGLRRTIVRVKLSNVTGVKPCSRCGY